ncbi:MAG: glycosyltransferase family 4 protein, partial [Acidobacteria bacterium]|nr:glycosyltransferase family 4 protein [Acidobacteriota bacterium]
AYTAPISLGSPLAVTVHDVSFSRHPEWFRFPERNRRHILTRLTARRAAVVLTVSEFSRSEISALYGLPRDRVRVIPNGLSPRLAQGPVAREPLILYAGSIFNRRRLPDLIAAFAVVLRSVPAAQLVIAGDNRTWPPQDLAAVAAAHGVTGKVALRQYVSDGELAQLYARASVFAYLSEYEGFGLTPLEALAAGVPVVLLDTPVAREVHGDAGRFVPRGDIEGTAAAIVELLTVRSAALEQLSRATGVLARYSWEAAADRTLAAIEGIAQL